MNKPYIENGVHAISNEQYHASSAISRSCLMELEKSPYHYWYKYLSGQYKSDDDKADLILGNAVHTLVLEERLFDNEFFITHQENLPKKGSAPHQEMMLKAGGRMILTNKRYETAKAIAKAVKNDAMANQLIYQGAKIEESIFFTHKETGIQCKARPDIRLYSLVSDLKTTANASFRTFQRSAVDYGYFLQAAMIHEALLSIDIKMDKFVYIAVEKKEPYPIGIFVLDDDALDYGIKQFNRLMQKLAICTEHNDWHSYDMQVLTLPAWANFDLGE